MSSAIALQLQVLCQLVGTQIPELNYTNLAVNQSLPEVQQKILPDGYIPHPEIGAAYKLYTNGMNWTGARERCNREGAYLAAMDSYQKLQYLPIKPGFQNSYLGIYRMEGEWVGIGTGSLTLCNIPWDEGYPDLGSGNCAVSQFGDNGLKTIIRTNCAAKLPYVCEIPITQNNQVQEIKAV